MQHTQHKVEVVDDLQGLLTNRVVVEMFKKNSWVVVHLQVLVLESRINMAKVNLREELSMPRT
jgi:hypothetical protein